MNKSPLPALTLKSITSVFRLKPLDELDSFMLLVQKRRFDQAMAQLQPNPQDSIMRLLTKYMTSVPPRKEPFLHMVLQSKPSTELFSLVWSAVNTYMGQDVTPDESLNSRKQTPLHVACLGQCSAEIIRQLLDGRSGMIPTICRDEDGRYPLHLLFLSDQLGPLSQVMEIVNWLLDCECFVAHMPDDYDRTPLDYARAKRVNDRIIDLLLEARIHLNDDDHDARPPTDPLQETERTSAPIPVAIEYDPSTADDISTLDMKETRSQTSLDFDWVEGDGVIDDYMADKTTLVPSTTPIAKIDAA